MTRSPARSGPRLSMRMASPQYLGIIVRDTFEVLLHPHLPALWRVIRRLVRESADAEDLLQEACLKAFRGWRHFQPGTDVKAWLLTILLNTYNT